MAIDYTEWTDEERLEAQVAPSLLVLLSDIVDYAGLFPPADLPFDEAIRNYARYRQEDDAWMLARFVLPVRRLDALTRHAGLLRQPPPFRFSVLGTGGADADAFLAAFATDLDAIAAFHRAHDERGLADVVEVRLPEGLHDADQPALLDFFDRVHRAIVTDGLASLDLFFEVPLDGELEHRLPTILAAMAEHNSRRSLPLRAEVGFKMRCGGPAPEDHPAPQYVAYAVDACRRAGVRFKATAGLHHPLRHYNDGVDASMHGFLNLFGAAALAEAHDLDRGTVQEILEDETAEHFRFDADGFAWNDLKASLDDVADTRERRAISFGSCSFDEPRDDLRDLELL